MKYLVIYLVIINIVGAAVTGYDKSAAVLHRRRVPESTLMLLSAVGAAPAMYLTMLIISHKTRKPKFMFGIPAVFIIELAAVLLLLHYVFKVI